MKKKVKKIHILSILCLLFCWACSGGGSGHSSNPNVTKPQDAQIDSPQTALPNLGARSSQVAVSSSITRTGRVFIAWLDQRHGECNVYFNCRDLEGTWIHSTDIRLDTGIPTNMLAEELSLVSSADGNIIHIVWANHQNGYEAIWYNRSTDGGLTFLSRAVCLSPQWPAIYPSSEPKIVCSQDGLVAYVVYRYGVCDIAFRYLDLNQSPDWPELVEGQFFVQYLCRGQYTAIAPSLACSDNGQLCHVVWQGGYYVNGADLSNYIWHRCWSLADQAWLTAQENSVCPYVGWHRSPQVDCNASGSSAYITWLWSEFREIMFAETKDYGATFTGEYASADDPLNPVEYEGNAFFPKIYCNRSTGECCLIWDKFAPRTASQIYDTWQVRTRKRASDGLSWGSIITISDPALKNNKPYCLPSMYGYNNNLVVGWIDYHIATNPSLYVNYSNDTGATWRNTTGMQANTPGGSQVYAAQSPGVFINSASQVYVTWTEKRDSSVPQVFGRDITALLITKKEHKKVEEIPNHQPTQFPGGWNPKIATNEANVYATWLSNRNGGYDIYIANSHNNGNDWNKDFIVNQNAGEMCWNHRLSVDTDNFIYIIWQKEETASTMSGISTYPGHFRGEKINQIIFQRYYFGNRDNPTFIHDHTYDFPETNTPTIPMITGVHNNTMLQTPNFPGMILSRDIVDSNDNASNPLLTHNGNGALYVIYNNSDDYCTAQARRYLSTDRGGSWSKKNNYMFVDSQNRYAEFLQADIIAESDILYWLVQVRGHHYDGQPYSRSDIFFLRHIQYMANDTPETKIRVDTGDPMYATNSIRPTMVKSGHKIFVAWTDFRNGNLPDIYFNYSIDNGANWYNAAPLNSDVSDLYSADHVQLTSHENMVYAVWTEYDKEQDAFHIATTYVDLSLAQSAQMGNITRIGAYRTTNSLTPQIACAGNKVYLTWHDNFTGGNNILVSVSNDYGVTWSLPQTFNTYALQGRNPQMSISQGWANVVWEDSRINRNIFFEARKP